MKKYKDSVLVLITFFCTIILPILLIMVFIKGWKYQDENLMNLPKGEYVYQIISPDKKNTVKVYIIYGGTLTADAYRVEVENKTKKNKKNIYVSYPCNKGIVIKWLDNETIEVHNKKINIYKDKIRSDCSN